MNWLWEENKKPQSARGQEYELKRSLFDGVDRYVDNQRYFQSGDDKTVRVGYGPVHYILRELFPTGIPMVPDTVYCRLAQAVRQCEPEPPSVLRCLFQEIPTDGIRVAENVRLREPGIRRDDCNLKSDFCLVADDRASLESVIAPIAAHRLSKGEDDCDECTGAQVLLASAVLVMKYRLELFRDIMHPHKEFFFGFNGKWLSVGVVKVENGKIIVNVADGPKMSPCLGDLHSTDIQSLVIRVLYGLLRSTPQQLGWIVPGECARVQGLELRAILGCGGFCTVYYAVSAGGEEEIALKAPKYGLEQEYTDFTLSHIRAEISALQECVRDGVCVHIPALSSLQSLTRAWVGFRDIGEPLAAHLSRLTDAQRIAYAKGVFYQSLLAAVCHAHRSGVVHNDIRPVNLLMVTLHGCPVLQLIDWGCATAPGTPIIVPRDLIYTYHEEILLATDAQMSDPSAQPDLRSAVEHDLAAVAYNALVVVLYSGETGFGKLPISDANASILMEQRQKYLEQEQIEVPGKV
jgi:hypothetical protein